MRVMTLKKGFTLVELLAVIGILSIILIILSSNVLSVANESKISIRDSKIFTIVTAGEEYGNDYINRYKDCLGNKGENVLSDNCTIGINDLTQNNYLESEDDDGNIIDPNTNEPFSGNILLCYNPFDVSIYGSYIEDGHYSCMDIDQNSGNSLYIKSYENGYVGGDAIESKIIKSGNFSKFTCESSNDNIATCSILNDEFLKIVPTKVESLIKNEKEEVVITLKGYYDGGVLLKTVNVTVYLTELKLNSSVNKCIKTNSTEKISIENSNGGALLSTVSPEDYMESEIGEGALYIKSNTKVGDAEINITELNGHKSLSIQKRIYNLSVDSFPNNLTVGFRETAKLTFEGTGKLVISSDNPDIVAFSSSSSHDADTITLNEGEDSFEVVSKGIGTANVTIRGETCGLVENIKFTGNKLNLSSTSGEIYLGGQSKSVEILTDTNQNLSCVSSDKEAASCLIQGSHLLIIPGTKSNENVSIKLVSSLGGEVIYNLKVLDTNMTFRDEHGEKIENVCKPYESVSSDHDFIYIDGNHIGQVSVNSISDENLLKVDTSKEDNVNKLRLQARNLLTEEALSPYKTGYNSGRTKVTIKEDNGNKLESFYYNIYSMNISNINNNAIFIGNYIDYEVTSSATGNITASSSNTDVAIVEVIVEHGYDSIPNSYNRSIVRVHGISNGKSDITIKGEFCGEKTYTVNVSSRDFYIDFKPGTYTDALGSDRLYCSAIDPLIGCQVVIPEIYTSDEYEIVGYSTIKDNIVSEYAPGNKITVTIENSGSILYGNSVDKKAPVCHFTNSIENAIINKDIIINMECLDTGSGIDNEGNLNISDFNISNSHVATITGISKERIENGFSYTINVITNDVGYFNIGLNGEVIKDKFQNTNDAVKTNSIISTEYTVIESWQIGKNLQDDVFAILYSNEEIFGESPENENKYSLELYGEGEMLDFWSDDYPYYPPWSDNYRSLITRVTINEGITNVGTHLMYNSFNLKEITLPEGIINIGRRAFANTNILSLSIPNSVVKIEDEAFYGNSNLSSLNLGDSLIEIGYKAFFEHKINSLIIPNSVQVINEEAFMSDPNSSSLSSLNLGNNVKNIQKNAFANHKVKSLTIPSSVEYIGEGAFQQQDSFSQDDILENLYIEENSKLKYIGNEAFLYSKFSNISLPETVEYVGNHALGSLDKSLSSFTIGKNVSHLGENFIFGEGLEEFIVDEENTNYVAIDGILYTSDNETLVKCPDLYYKRENHRLDIPTSVKVIAPGAFAGTQNNESGVQGLDIFIPETIENLNLESNFIYFTISSLNLSNDNYESIDGVLFNKELTTIYRIPPLLDREEYVIPETVETVADYCAYANSRIKTLNISENVVTIESYAFQSDPNYGFSQINIYSRIPPVYYISSFAIMLYEDADINTRTRTINVVNDVLYETLISDYDGADYEILVRMITDE